MKDQDDKKVSSLGPESSRKFATKLDQICTKERNVDPKVLRSIIELAIEIAREGREGRKIGTMFVVGDQKAVLPLSKELILDPLFGHLPEKKHITDPNMRETIKELAQLDGAFVVSEGGTVLSAARYIEANSEKIELPLGLGSRHLAAASISYQTEAVAVVVSESSIVRIVDNGKIIAEIIPELWLTQRTEPDASKIPSDNFWDRFKNLLSQMKS